MNNEKNKCYIVLLNYKSWKDTIECIESILKLDENFFQLLVVDNNSQDDSFQKLLDWANGKNEVDQTEKRHTEIDRLIFPCAVKPINFQSISSKELEELDERALRKITAKIIFIENSENKGFSAGNNVALKYIMRRGDSNYIWILNTDIVVAPNTLSHLIESAVDYRKKGVRIGIVGCKLRYYYQPDLIQGIGGKFNRVVATAKHVGAFEKDVGQFNDEKCRELIDYPLGASMFVLAEFVEDVGLLCEDYFLYYEEMDWVLRGWRKGWSIGYCGNVEIYHKEGGVIGSDTNAKNKSELSDFFVLRNKIVFTRKFYPKYLFFVYLSFLVIAFNRVKRGQFSRLKMIIKALREAM